MSNPFATPNLLVLECEAQSLVPLVLGVGQVVQPLLWRHGVPLGSFRLLPPDVVDLDETVEHNVHAHQAQQGPAALRGRTARLRRGRSGRPRRRQPARTCCSTRLRPCAAGQSSSCVSSAVRQGGRWSGQLRDSTCVKKKQKSFGKLRRMVVTAHTTHRLTAPRSVTAI